MPIKRKGRYNYSTIRFRYPSSKQEVRIKIPGIIKRPVRFQTRSLIQRHFLRPESSDFTLHVRGPKGRPRIGMEPLEMRAAQISDIGRGTLPERIIYKYLVDGMHFVEGVDFDFQSSLQGGRVDTGGIVADFLFEYLRLVLNPTGPTHDEFIRIAKDREQTMALQEMGYDVYLIPEDDIYNEERFNRWMDMIFGVTSMSGSGSISDNPNAMEEVSPLTAYIAQ